MATISPFKAVRPTRDKVGLFATRTYLSYSKKGLSEKLFLYFNKNSAFKKYISILADRGF